MIVDTHVHVVSEDQRRYPRIANPLEWVRDMSGETLLALDREAGVDRTVLVQAYTAYECDNSYAADCARQYPDRFASVCVLDQRRADAPDQLTYWVRERGASGLRLFTTIAPEPLLDDPQTFPIWTRATSLRIPICIMTRFHQVARLPAVMERFPDIPVALDHLALPRLKDGPPYDSLQPLFDLVHYPNLYLKFSTETLYAARRGRSTPKEFFSCLIEQFGVRRIMWGSNFPATHDRSFKEQVDLAREALAFLPQEELRWLFSETALSVWPALS